MRAFTELRPVTITITGAPAPIDFYDAVINKVKASETQYEQSLDYYGDTTLTNLSAVNSLITGKTPYKVHACAITINWASGAYTFAYDDTYPNAETANA